MNDLTTSAQQKKQREKKRRQQAWEKMFWKMTPEITWSLYAFDAETSGT